MKKIQLLLLLLISISAFSQTLEVPQSKKALLFKATASWCSPCGYYHYVTEEIYNEHSDSILFLNGHVASSDVGDNFSGDMHNLLNGGGGIPSYSLSGVELADWPPTVDMIIEEATNFFNEEITANIAFEYQINGNELTINSTTKFFQDITADKFYVGVMVLENNILVNQKVDEIYEEMIQHRIQRTVIGELNDMGEGKKLWADEIASGDITSGTEINHSFTKTLDDVWDYDELNFIVVIWKRVADSFIALSAEDVGEEITTGINTVENENSFEIFPNPTNQTLNVRLNSQQNATVTITDQVGRILFSQKTDNDFLKLDVSQFNKGFYIINVIEKSNSKSKGFIVQ